MESLKRNPKQGGRNTGVDLVLSCVDNYEARMVVNQVITFSPGLHNISYIHKLHTSSGIYALSHMVVIVQACNELNQTWMESGKRTCPFHFDSQSALPIFHLNSLPNVYIFDLLTRCSLVEWGCLQNMHNNIGHDLLILYFLHLIYIYLLLIVLLFQQI